MAGVCVQHIAELVKMKMFNIFQRYPTWWQL